jgi:cyclopropane fatty-acyl-phospholipid synthase-like methyltransferase
MQVTGVDSSSVGLTKAQALAQQEGVTITTQVADLAEWDGFGITKWDAIVSIFAHLPPAVRKHVHQACVAALKPGGIMLLEAYTPAQLEHKTGGPQSIDMLYTQDMLMQDFSGLQVRFDSNSYCASSVQHRSRAPLECDDEDLIEY